MTIVTAADEQLVVFPRTVLDRLGWFEGLQVDYRSYLSAALADVNRTLLARSWAEHDPRYKQLVTYVLLACGDRLFVYQRSATSGEPRLAGRRSLGIGGHVNSSDLVVRQRPEQTILTAARRELEEEIAAATPVEVTILALLNEDNTEVSRVHLGIVALARIAEPAVSLRDPSLSGGSFWRIADLEREIDSFETWSQHCIRAVADGLLR